MGTVHRIAVRADTVNNYNFNPATPCRGCISLSDVENTKTTLKLQHPDWTPARIAARALISTIKGETQCPSHAMTSPWTATR